MPKLQNGASSWLAGAGLIVVLTLATYWPSLSGGFVLDDDLLLVGNPIVQSANGLSRFWFSTEPADYWPMTNSSFWLEWRLWGTDSTGYHVTNLLLHIAAALLIWAILRRLAIPGAFLGALLFAVHPVNVESVAWISQRKNTLAMFFFLLSILCYLRADRRDAAEGNSKIEELRSNRLRGAWYWLSLIAFVLAMLSKGSVAILPLVVLLLVWWQFNRIRMSDVVRTVPFFVVAIVLTLVNIWFQTHGSEHAIRDASLVQRIAGAGAVVWFYLSKAFVPIELLFVYPQWQIKASHWQWWLPLAGAIAVTATLLRSAVQPEAKMARTLLFAWLLFCLALAPVMGFVDVGYMQYSLVADHYQYLALISVATLVAAGWWQWQQNTQGVSRRMAETCAIVVIGTLAFLTWQQSQLYASPISLYEATLVRNPNSWLVRNDLGVAFYKSGRSDLAIVQYEQALQLQPNYFEAHYNFGNALQRLGEYQRAIKQYEQTLQLNPDYAAAYDNLGSALAKAGRTSEAIEPLEHSLKIKPDSSTTLNNLGNVLAAAGQLPQAIDRYQRALELNPNYAEAHNNLGVALLDSNRPQEALPHFEQALKLKPNYIDAYINQASAYSEIGRSTEAIAAAQQALELAHSEGQVALAHKVEAWLSSYRTSLPNTTENQPSAKPPPAAP